MIMSLKQKKRKFKPRIKLNHNVYGKNRLLDPACRWNSANEAINYINNATKASAVKKLKCRAQQSSSFRKQRMCRERKWRLFCMWMFSPVILNFRKVRASSFIWSPEHVQRKSPLCMFKPPVHVLSSLSLSSRLYFFGNKCLGDVGGAPLKVST